METVTSVQVDVVASKFGLSGHIPALDGLRGLAILAVFFHHYGAGGIASHSLAVRWIAVLCGLGWSGVDLFFVLSGFLITGILYDTQQDPGYYRRFYARRALRIFPIYYLFALIVLLIVPFHVWHLGDILFLVYLGYPAALIWPALVNLPIRITHLWSLAVEEQFYVLWPWLIRRIGKPFDILRLCAAAAVVSIVIRIMFPGWAYASLPCRMDDLALGGAIAILFRIGLRNRLQQLALPVFSASVVVVILICIYRHTTSHDDHVVCTAGFTIIALAYGALLILAQGPFSGLFSTQLLRTFGKYSYGMYLYHFPLTAAFEHAKHFFGRSPLGSLMYVGTCLAANLVIAAISFHVFEQPILHLKKRFEYAREAGAVHAQGQLAPIGVAEPAVPRGLVEASLGPQ